MTFQKRLRSPSPHLWLPALPLGILACGSLALGWSFASGGWILHTSARNFLQPGSQPLPGSFAITLRAAQPGQLAVLISSAGPASLPLAGGRRLLSAPLTRERTFLIGGSGGAHLAMVVHSSLVGSARYYQVYCRDPGDAAA